MDISRLDRRWIFLLIGLVTVVLFKVPIEPKMTISKPTQGYYDAIESIPAGATIHISADYGPSTIAEIYPMHVATLRRLFERDVKVICTAIWPEGLLMTDRAFREVVESLHEEGIVKEHGRDYVNLGFKAGNEVVMAKLGTSFPETFPSDAKGTAVNEIDVMRGIENYDDIALLISLSSGVPGVRQWLQQIQMRYNVRVIGGVTAVMAPDLYSFHQTGQLEGFLGGMVGAAEYEALLRRPGSAIAGMNIQSLNHFLIVALVFLGNLALLIQKKKKQTRSR
jgi:hypothetical protein